MKLLHFITPFTKSKLLPIAVFVLCVSSKKKNKVVPNELERGDGVCCWFVGEKFGKCNNTQYGNYGIQNETQSGENVLLGKQTTT